MLGSSLLHRGLLARLGAGGCYGVTAAAATAAGALPGEGKTKTREATRTFVESAKEPKKRSGLMAPFTNPCEKDQIAVVMERGEGVYVYDT